MVDFVPPSHVISHAMPVAHCVWLSVPHYFSYLLLIIKMKLQLCSGNSIWMVSTEITRTADHDSNIYTNKIW